MRELEYEARAALNWIDEYADLMGNGYVSYKRRNEETGLENQCWKDSWDSISYRDGTAARLPAGDLRAPGLRLRREGARRPPGAPRLEGPGVRRQARDARPPTSSGASTATSGSRTASTSRSALDADGNQVDALASNIGHLLWSGIVDKSKAKAVVRHLMGPRLFSGWGVRTLAEGEGRYNPIGYHVGTVWPFDNSFIAWGLRRYGFKEEAAQIAAGILDAAAFFDGRLPEAFGGYDRALTKYPVQYPTACSPQAWSTGTPLLLLRTMLGLEPLGEHLVVDPALPVGHRPSRAARHPRALGPHRRLRPRARRRRNEAAPAPAARRGTSREVEAQSASPVNPSAGSAIETRLTRPLRRGQMITGPCQSGRRSASSPMLAAIVLGSDPSCSALRLDGSQCDANTPLVAARYDPSLAKMMASTSLVAAASSCNKEVLIELQEIAWVTKAQHGVFRMSEALRAAPSWVWPGCL